jgi:hypothetical protein
MHLNYRNKNTHDITLMNKYDRNILEIFNYYNREYVLIKYDESTKANEKLLGVINDNLTDTRKSSNESDGGYLYEVELLIKTNQVILNGINDYSEKQAVSLITDLVLKNERYINFFPVIKDFKTFEYNFLRKDPMFPCYVLSKKV